MTKQNDFDFNRTYSTVFMHDGRGEKGSLLSLAFLSSLSIKFTRKIGSLFQKRIIVNFIILLALMNT